MTDQPDDFATRLAPARAALVAAKTTAKPHGVDYDAATDAIAALDRASVRLSGAPIERPRVPIIGEVGDGGVVTFYPGGRELMEAAVARASQAARR